MSVDRLELIIPDWPGAENVKAFTTTRGGGVSSAPWYSFNLGDHVGDDPGDVMSNRDTLLREGNLPAMPLWLKQVHGCDVADAESASTGCIADAAYADEPGKVCAVLTADCLPLLLADRRGGEVAAVHAGWRGLAAGVVESAIARFEAAPDDLLAWMGPAIGPDAFEVGDDVRDAFLRHDESAEAAFVRKEDRWLANLYLLARQRMGALGLSEVFGGDRCTFTEARHFYSFRRDGETGRMASLIWLE